MKPKYLSFCGINSFSKKAEIDFEKLLSGGIFGIFGDTGSGKTTILDAMIFALYGRVDRIRGGNGNEIINYNCDKAQVLFDFETETHDGRKIYRIEREIKRKNSAQSLTLSELSGKRVIAISDGVKNTNAKIQEIVGLSFEDFKKCIALPQGEFAQFVKSERGDRLRLISRLFGLERFGDVLNARIKEKYAAVKSLCDSKEGELRGYADADETVLKQLKEDAKQLESQKTELDLAYANYKADYEKVKAAYERTNQRNQLSEQLTRLFAKREEMDGLEIKAKQIPTAREIVELRRRLNRSEKEKAETLQAQDRASADKKNSQQALDELVASFDAEANKTAAEEINGKLAKISYAKTDAELLKGYARQRESLREEYQKIVLKQSGAKKRAQEQEILREKIADKLEKLGKLTPEAYLAERLDSALLASEFRSAKEYFEKSRSDLHRDFSGGELFERVDAELVKKAAEYAAKLEREKSADASELLESFKKLQRQREELLSEQNAHSLERAKAESEAAEAEKELARIKSDGEKIADTVKKQEEKIRNALGVSEIPDFAALEKNLHKQRKELLDSLELFTKKCEDLKKKIRDDELEETKCGTMLARLEIGLAEDRSKLQELLAASGFSDEEKAQKLLEEIPQAEPVLRKVESFRKELHEVQAKLSLLGDGASENISEEEFQKSEQQMRFLAQKKEDVTKKSAVYAQQVADLEKRAEVRKRLEKELKSQEAELFKIARLRDLVRGNAFMEFVASEYLSDISVAASKTLLQLTGGRYFIRYKSGFVIIDNLCGGEERSVNTLSGGETFLVSLSLALALSSAIYAKSLRPIEFFFLDEGFGTLDEKLIDTVMDSLEKLKNSKFSIGLISHVEELKHRINNKITVTGAAEGGSSEIQISC